MQLLDQVHSGQQQLLQLWQLKRNKLDQCLQLRMFEQDCEKVTGIFGGFDKASELYQEDILKNPVLLEKPSTSKKHNKVPMFNGAEQKIIDVQKTFY